MTTTSNQPYLGISREELAEGRRLAHAERAKVVRAIFTGLMWWRWKAAEGPAPDAALKLAHGQ